MTKQELLDELLAKDYINTVEEPQLMETKPDGAKWYKVNVSETFQKVAVYRNIDFYVFDEGGAEEKAYYKDREPSMYVSPSAFRSEMNEALKNDPEILGWTFRVSRETFRIAMVEALIEDDQNPSMLIPVLFLVGFMPDSTLWKKRVNLSPEIVAQTARVE
ncbi:MAG: hypothetical protein LC687_06135 [Actinobacteria bacterium]|nr:hypothetical protein [Actinomycetota bacterium]